MKITTFYFVLIFLLLFGVACDSFAENTNTMQTDRYFIHDLAPGHGDYLWLRSNGSYWLVSRGIEGELYGDNGTWSQKGDEITLKSGRELRQILSPTGNLKIYLTGFTKDNKELNDYLTLLKKATMEFLEKNKSNKFTHDEVEKIYINRYKGLNSPGIDVYGRTVERGSLENLIKAIDDFMASNEKNAFHTRLEKNKSSTCLFWLDGTRSLYSGCFEEVSKNVFGEKGGKCIFDEESR